MNQEQWYSIPGFFDYEISSIGNARYLSGKPLRLHQYKGFSLRRNGQFAWYIQFNKSVM